MTFWYFLVFTGLMKSAEVAKNPARFAAFASLSMHDPATAIKEARRAIKELNFVGFIINDFQQYTDANGQMQMRFYDQPEYDEFWQVVSEELKVPVYIHPRLAIPQHLEQFLSGRIWLAASAYYFAHGVSLHVLGMVVNGVFDRFPKLKIIVGHMGEHIVGHRWRSDHRLQAVQSGRGLPMKATLQEYFKRGNIYITTSGHFSTKALRYSVDEIGPERVMFSIVLFSLMSVNRRTTRMRLPMMSSIHASGGRLSMMERNIKIVQGKLKV
jgi:2,3-dihydroxybenzoate decarboxylase